jgi:hypothetical protein
VAAVLAIRHACIVAELTSNKAKEDAAVAWVMELERAAGRQPRDTRYTGAPGVFLSLAEYGMVYGLAGGGGVATGAGTALT